jgi:ABC-type thiamine transport system ATPase subunit
MTRFIVLAVRSAPESSSRDENFSALRPDLRQRMPAVVAGISRSVLRATMYEERKKEAERRTTRVGTNRISRCGARFAKRARLSAFHHGSVPLGLFIPRLNLGQAS